MRVLIVGAGPTGALISELLSQLKLAAPLSISVWEKSRGCGGRMATTRFSGAPVVSADTGAQYISCTLKYQTKHERFYDRLLRDSVIEPLAGKEIIGDEYNEEGTKQYTCPTGMSSIAKYYLKSSGAELKLDTRLADIQCQQGTVVATAESGYRDTFDMVILTIPATQVLQLGGINDITEESERAVLQSVRYSCRFALAIRLPDGFEPPVTWTAMYSKENKCVRYVCLDTRKRSKGQPHSLVVHTSVPYGLDHLEEDKDVVGRDILACTRQVLPWLPDDESLVIKSHKWRYSQVHRGVDGEPGCLRLAKQSKVLICGDAFMHSNLDGCIASAESTIESVQQAMSMTRE